MTGQMTIWDFLPKKETLPCDTCKYDEVGCCAYDTRDDWCELGNKWEPKSLEDIPEEEMVQRIGNAIGVNFVWNDYYKEYQAKLKGYTLSVEYDRYCIDLDEDIGTGHRFVGVGFMKKGCGAAGPCDSIDEAIEWFLDRKEELIK